MWGAMSEEVPMRSRPASRDMRSTRSASLVGFVELWCMWPRWPSLMATVESSDMVVVAAS